jgi:hypothetical protein
MVDTDLPEEQGTEFEKIENWQHFLLGPTAEADTQYGFTQKEFRPYDLSLFLNDDWQVSPDLTVNLGARWDFYKFPWERNGFLGNFIPSLVTDPDDPSSGIRIPSNAQLTGNAVIDPAVESVARSDSRSTLDGERWGNVAPRVGFAWKPGGSERLVVRGGYGIYYDGSSWTASRRPSARVAGSPHRRIPWGSATATAGTTTAGRPGRSVPRSARPTSASTTARQCSSRPRGAHSATRSSSA